MHVNSACESNERDFEFRTYKIEFVGKKWKKEHNSSINESPFNIYPLVYLFVVCCLLRVQKIVCAHCTMYILCARVYIVDIFIVAM